MEIRLALSGFGDLFGDEFPPFELPPEPPPADFFASGLGIADTEPAEGEIRAGSPTTLTLVFDRPVDPNSLLGFGDLILERIEDDGSATPVFDPEMLPSEFLDESGTRLEIFLDAPLAPGKYRLRLSEMTSATALDGSFPSFAALAESSEFTVDPAYGSDVGEGEESAPPVVEAPSVPTLDEATDLGEIGAGIRAVSSSLDPSAASGSVRLYRIELRSGHFWRLGLEVSATRDGSPLDATLALFDEFGQLLATARDGRSDAPADPFLFAGLAPGVYYVGVSSEADVPGAEGGYDPITGRPGIAGGAGDFTLALIADRANEPAAVTSSRLDHADPIDPTPTGFSLRFSQAMNLATGKGVEVVDASGRTWPIVPTGYDEASGRLAFLFRKHLPAGTYQVRVAAVGGLADLAGRAPTAPGLPEGTLANFSVDQAPDRSDMDFGPIAPDALAAGLIRTFRIPAGGTVSISYAVPIEGLYRIKVAPRGGSVEASWSAGGSGQASATEGGVTSRLVKHAAGRYTLEFSGAEGTEFDITLDLPGAGFDSILANGLGQGSALNLRLVSEDGPTVAPTPGSVVSVSEGFTIAAPSGPTAGPFAPEAATTSTPASAPSGPSAEASSSSEASELRASSGSSSSLAFEIGGTLVGRPDAEVESTAAVGPGGPSSGTAVALAGTAPGQALAVAGIFRGSPRPGTGVAGHEAPIVDGSIPPESFAPTDSEVIPASGEVATTDDESHPDLGTTTPTTEVQAEEALTEAPAETEQEPTEVATAAISPWLAGAAAVAAIGARWWARRRSKNRRVATRAIPTPHAAMARSAIS